MIVIIVIIIECIYHFAIHFLLLQFLTSKLTTEFSESVLGRLEFGFVTNKNAHVWLLIPLRL